MDGQEDAGDAGLAAQGIAIVRPQGRLDLGGLAGLDKALADAARHNCCIVDLSGVAFLASVGIRSLIHAARDLNARGGRMVLLGPSHDVEKVLVVSGVSSLLPLVHGLDEAVRLAKADG